MRKKIAIITGASGGIGREFVSLMTDENIDEIWCIARNQDKLDMLKEKFGKQILPISIDLSIHESLMQIEQRLKGEKLNVMYLINNVGIGEKLSSYKELSLERSYETIQVNCTTLISLCIMCIPYMQNGSKIINVSSQSSFQPVPYLNLYAATKAFVTSYTRALNVELKSTGILATVICSGWTDTTMLPQTLNGKKVKYPGIVSPKVVAVKGLRDAKKGKDISVCTFYVKYMRLLSKILPHKSVMRVWSKKVSKYL